MTIAITIIHVLGCIGLILTVLLQTGKGASMGAAFGGSSQTVFGSVGATTFLAKMTTGIAILFMVTSLGLAVISSRMEAPSSVMSNTPVKTVPAKKQPAPVPTRETPAPPTQGAGK